jgi:hypothetical protein
MKEQSTSELISDLKSVFRIEWGKSYIVNKGQENELIVISGSYTTSEQFIQEIATAFEIEVKTIELFK